MNDNSNTTPIIQTKEFRFRLDKILQEIKEVKGSRENSLTITKLQEAIMWQGMELKRLGEATPYPNSYDASNTVVEPTADGLKL